MAEGAGKIYRSFKEDVMEGHHDLTSNALKVILVSGHALDTAGDDVYTDVSADEVASGSGYTTGGAALTSLAVTETGTGTGTSGERGMFDAANLTWSSLNIGGTSASPSHAILYNDTPTSPADPLIASWEVTTATNGGNYTLAWNAGGLIILYGGN